MIISVWIIIGSCLELSLGGYISLAIFLAVGIILQIVMNKLRGPGKDMELRTLTPEDIKH